MTRLPRRGARQEEPRVVEKGLVLAFRTACGTAEYDHARILLERGGSMKEACTRPSCRLLCQPPLHGCRVQDQYVGKRSHLIIPPTVDVNLAVCGPRHVAMTRYFGHSAAGHWSVPIQHRHRTPRCFHVHGVICSSLKAPPAGERARGVWSGLFRWSFASSSPSVASVRSRRGE